MKRLTETVYQESIERIDVENGVLYGVKVLGENSRNRRRYVAKAMREAAPKYEGVNSYVDHPDRSSLSEDRKFASLSGVLRNPRYVEGKGIFADLHLLKEGTFFKGIIEAAQKFPKSVGFSHVAEGESHIDGDTEIIESIREVFSVDLVTSPATTAGIFESTQRDTIREATESLPEEHPLRKRLSEMMDAGYMNGGPLLGGDNKPSDPVGQLTALVGQLTSALADALKSLAKANQPKVVTPPPPTKPDETPPGEEGDEGETEDEEMSDEDKGKLAAFESITRENAELKASKLLLESGRQATPVRMKALANCTTEDEQRELLESWPKVDENGRPARSPALIEADANDFPRDNPEKFAALLR